MRWGEVVGFRIAVVDGLRLVGSRLSWLFRMVRRLMFGLHLRWVVDRPLVVVVVCPLLTVEKGVRHVQRRW